MLKFKVLLEHKSWNHTHTKLLASKLAGSYITRQGAQLQDFLEAANL